MAPHTPVTDWASVGPRVPAEPDPVGRCACGETRPEELVRLPEIRCVACWLRREEQIEGGDR